MQERGRDAKGHGDFGMPRGGRKHRGWDVVGEPGAQIKAPFSGQITKYGYMYRNVPEFRYVEITGETYRIRLGYSELNAGLKVGDFINEADCVSILQDIASYWRGGMQNHLHIEIYKNGLLTDPEPLFKIL